MAYYAVRKGKKTGVYNTWEECQEQILGISGAIYKKFKDKREAYNFAGIQYDEDYEEAIKTAKVKAETVRQNSTDLIEEIATLDKVTVYTDGSYNAKEKVAGYGVVLVKDGKAILKDFGKIHGSLYIESRNVLSELYGALKAMELAIANGIKSIEILYDYVGVQKWATGSWKANKELTKYYQVTSRRYMSKVNVTFVKVEAHTGIKYNEMADELAKLATGIL